MNDTPSNPENATDWFHAEGHGWLALGDTNAIYPRRHTNDDDHLTITAIRTSDGHYMRAHGPNVVAGRQTWFQNYDQNWIVEAGSPFQLSNSIGQFLEVTITPLSSDNFDVHWRRIDELGPRHPRPVDISRDLKPSHVKLSTSDVTGAPQEFIETSGRALYFDSNINQCPNHDVALDNVLHYLNSRVMAVLEQDKRRPVVLLSGGIDSVLLAAVVARHAPNALAVTVEFNHHGQNTTENNPDTLVASAVCHHLGLEHRIAFLSHYGTKKWAGKAARRLGTGDLWEVLAGTVLLAANDTAHLHGAGGPLFTGAGADALFNGGSTDYVSQRMWHEKVADSVAREFTYARNIPDFYERLLDEPERHIKTWQTKAAVELAMALRPEHVRGVGHREDKKLLREAAIYLGVPDYLTRRPKSPMQLSSGGVNGLVQAARHDLADDPSHTAYADPRTEPIEHTVARLWLQQQR